MRLLSLSMAVFLLNACTSGPRVLSEEERLRLGLVGLAYDIPLCPTGYDPKTQESKVNGPCELVTCEMEKEKVICKAVPQPKPRR